MKTRTLVRKACAPIERQWKMLRSRNRTKYFCIGRNKTGTTSLKKAFEDLGYVVADQRKAEKLYDRYYFDGQYGPIIRFCKYGQVFQDVPFSCPGLFRYLDFAYPGSKFILTVREDSNEWYRSITRFHARKFGDGTVPPTVDELKRARYVRKGFMYNTVKLHGTPDDDPYNKAIMTAHYEDHNKEVIEYFRDRPHDLFVINVSAPDAWERFVNFLGVRTGRDQFPWENKT